MQIAEKTLARRSTKPRRATGSIPAKRAARGRRETTRQHSYASLEQHDLFLQMLTDSMYGGSW